MNAIDHVPTLNEIPDSFPILDKKLESIRNRSAELLQSRCVMPEGPSRVLDPHIKTGHESTLVPAVPRLRCPMMITVLCIGSGATQLQLNKVFTGILGGIARFYRNAWVPCGAGKSCSVHFNFRLDVSEVVYDHVEALEAS
ncbi:hypothetical protein BYT27DRAFT_7212065 [Phlegmacium glaucopus]|nr:hypothetical protein BYT27DRAFT_7212065 [Phlegmacium glaucopus]